MRIFAAALLLASISAPAVAQPSRDTLAAAVDSALDNNPSLMAQRRTRAVADESLKQANASRWPTVGLSGSYGTQELEFGRTITTPVGSFPLDGRQERSQVGLEARQPIYAGGALSAQRDQARAGVSAAEAQLRSTEQGLMLDVVTAFVDVRRAEQEVAFRQTNVGSLGQQVQAAKDRFEAGEVTRTDVAQAEAREAGAVGELAASRAKLEASRAIYERIVGRPPVQLAEPPPAPQLPGTLDQAVGLARNSNPQLLAARAQELAAEEAVRVAKGAVRPRFDLVGNAGLTETYTDQTFRDTNVGVTAQLSIPLFQGGLLSSKTRGARLEAERARYDRMAVEREVTAQTTSAWHAVIAAREGITASQSRVAAAEIALEGATQELAVGTRITLDVLDQERELLEAQLGLVEAERAAYIAIHQLLAAMGQLKPELSGR